VKTRKEFSVRDRLRSLKYAFRGVAVVLRTQHNAWIHFLCSVLAFLLSYWLEIGRIKFCIVILAVATVWAAEALNTACEILVNMVSPRFSQRAGRVKDIGAAAVLMTSIGALVVGLVIFGPPLMERLR
jgi:diacylglycerol kinase